MTFTVNPFLTVPGSLSILNVLPPFSTFSMLISLLVSDLRSGSSQNSLLILLDVFHQLFYRPYIIRKLEISN